MTLRLPRNRFLTVRKPFVFGRLTEVVGYSTFRAYTEVRDGKKCVVLLYADENGV